MPDGTRSVVKTTVPQYQKDIWVEHADELDMSQSEFVRTMVQAGRQDFDLEPPERPVEDATPGVDGLESRVLDVLSGEDYRSFDEIVSVITEDVERSVDEILQTLTSQDRIDHSNVEGGYRLNGASDVDH